MNEEQLKEFLERNLEIKIEPGYIGQITVRLYLCDNEISSDTVDLAHTGITV